MRTRILVTSATAIAVIALVAVKVVLVKTPTGVKADGTPPEVLRLRGVIRDFQSSHPDFDVTDAAQLGHSVRNVGSALPADRRPAYLGSGVRVASQWRDKNANPIMPYVPADDGGLPGGHFDVDVFDEATDDQLYHKHQFDDSFDVTYVDVAHDENLLFREIIPPGYPNDLRLEFINPHHSSGTFTFQAGGPPIVRNAREPFEITFDPNAMAKCRVDFAWLLELRGTSPGDVQDDIVDRDDSFAMRMYDVTTGELVYELAVYHHGEEGSMELPESAGGEDSCGASIDDSIGDFGDAAGGAVTSADSLSQWYRDVLGTNLSKLHIISLYRNSEGVYEYLTDEFHPIDGQLLGDEGDTHNNFLTYMIPATFTYDACAGQFFEFEGNDDCWVYIDGTLVLDLGGVATPSRQYIAVDRLELVDGQQYTFDFFFAHRRDAMDSVFRMRTNIPLCTTGSVPVSGTYD